MSFIHLITKCHSSYTVILCLKQFERLLSFTGSWKLQKTAEPKGFLASVKQDMSTNHSHLLKSTFLCSTVPNIGAINILFGIRQTDCELMRSRINNNWCRASRPHRPLSTAYKTIWYAVDKGLRGRTSCISCYWFCYVSAHNRFTRYRQCSNEPLQHHPVRNHP